MDQSPGVSDVGYGVVAITSISRRDLSSLTLALCEASCELRCEQKIKQKPTRGPIGILKKYVSQLKTVVAQTPN